MKKGLLKLLLVNLMLIPSVLTFAQLGQNGSIMPIQQKKISIDQQLTPNKSVTSIFEEDFSGNAIPAPGWTIIGDSDANWHIWGGTNAGGTAPECGFGWNPHFTGYSKMVSPEIATSGATTLVLEFKHYVWDYAGSGYSYSIETTSDGGTTWNEVWSISPTGDVPAEIVTLVIENEDVGSDNFQFAVGFEGSTSQINYWYIDDFILSAEAVEAYDVTYTVKDESNNPVENASVNMQNGGTLTTDAAGEVVFENILPGVYTWWAAAVGLATEEGSVTVTDEAVSVDIVLTISDELLSEHFAGGGSIPEGWSIVGDGASNWSKSNTTFAGAEYPELRFDYNPAFNGESKFVSPEVVTIGYTDLFLDFDYYLLDASGSDCSIKVKTTSDGGTTWNEVWSVTPTGDMGPIQQTIIISNDDVGSDAFQFAFTVEGNSAHITNWYIDDVILTSSKQYDAAIVSIDIPALLAPGVDMAPSVEVINLGAQTIDFDVTVEFADGGNVYSETITLTDFAPLQTETVVFPTWTSIAGSFDGEASVNLVDDENLENDLVVFDIQVASGLVAKMPLYEMLTSSTCPPCVFANEALDALLDVNPGEYSLIKYQVNWPGSGDPYYIAEAGVRVGYYEVTSVPSLQVNAENFSPALNITQDDFDAFQEAETALEIEITEATINNDNMITIAAELLSKVNYAAGLSAHIVVVEKTTYENVGSNGETEFHNVMMAMLPSASGETLDALVTDVPVMLNQSYDMDETFMETNDDLAVVVFVQNDIDKSIVQSAMIDVTVGGSVAADCENFDALSDGDLVAEQLGGMWTTWSGTNTDDATVSDMYSNSPDNSFVVDATSVDLIRKFDDVAIDGGQWLYSNYIYVPTGFSGYFNVQSDPTPGVAWVVDLFFNDDGTGYFETSSSATFTYEQNTWINVEINFDLDANFAEVYFDGSLITAFAWEGSIGGIDYYGSDTGGTPGAYFDDVCFGEGWVYTSIEEKLANTLQLYPNPANDFVNIKSDNTIETITVYNFAGQTILTETVNNSSYSINTSKLDAGIYLFQIETNEGRIAKRVIIE